MIERTLKQTILENFYRGKAIIILGSRQVGKSTLMNQLVGSLNLKVLNLDCDDRNIRNILEKASTTELIRLIGDNQIIIVDEAQRVDNIGLALKIIIDKLSPKQLLVSGSSSFDLTNIINEPLTARKFEYFLFPLSLKEISNHFGYMEAIGNLENYLVYGTYPDVINNSGNEIEILKNLTDSYLFKDIFSFQNLRKSEFLESLLEALAFQLGSEVSYNELALMLGSNPHTVKNYIAILERAFVVFRLRSFSRNERNEIKKSRKIYFYDNGIRNTIISNFNRFESRTDKGALWENFVISERMKYLNYNKIYSKRYFWRTTQKQEIDYLEEYNGIIKAFQIKWNPNSKYRFSKTFTSNYPESEYHLIHKDNIWDFLDV